MSYLKVFESDFDSMILINKFIYLKKEFYKFMIFFLLRKRLIFFLHKNRLVLMYLSNI